MQAKSIVRVVIGTALILSVPFVAMQFTDEVQWDMRDFIVMGALLVGTGLAFELVAAKANPKYRPIIAVVFLIALLLVWAELAVGIFGSPFAGS